MCNQNDPRGHVINGQVIAGQVDYMLTAPVYTRDGKTQIGNRTTIVIASPDKATVDAVQPIEATAEDAATVSAATSYCDTIPGTTVGMIEEIACLRRELQECETRNGALQDRLEAAGDAGRRNRVTIQKIHNVLIDGLEANSDPSETTTEKAGRLVSIVNHQRETLKQVNAAMKMHATGAGLAADVARGVKELETAKKQADSATADAHKAIGKVENMLKAHEAEFERQLAATPTDRARAYGAAWQAMLKVYRGEPINPTIDASGFYWPGRMEIHGRVRSIITAPTYNGREYSQTMPRLLAGGDYRPDGVKMTILIDDR